MLGMHDLSADHMADKLEDTLPVIKQVSEQFKNPVCLLSILFPSGRLWKLSLFVRRSRIIRLCKRACMCAGMHLSLVLSPGKSPL